MGCRDSDIQMMTQMVELFTDLYPSLEEANDQDMIKDFRGALETYVGVLIETNTSLLSKDEIDFLRLINGKYKHFLPDGYESKIYDKLYFLLDDYIRELRKKTSDSAHK